MAGRDPLGPADDGHSLTAAGRSRRWRSRAAEALLGHRFRPPGIAARGADPPLRGAAKGRGQAKGAGSNERLEFVGDRVLGLLMAEWLAERFPEEQEGELGRRLALLVSQPVLADDRRGGGAAGGARGRARRGAGPGVRRRATVLADATEAAIGALFLDGGLDAARRFRPPRLGAGDGRAARAAQGCEDRAAGMGAGARPAAAGLRARLARGARRTRRSSSSR